MTMMPGGLSYDAIRQAAEASPPTPKVRGGDRFSLTRAGVGEGFMAVWLGVYLAYAAVRVHEVFPVLEVPRLPLILTIMFALGLAALVPSSGWRTIWARSRSMRLVAAITGIAIVTTPIGIWVQGSLDFLVNRFFVTVTVFLSCAVFLRDRRLLRRAVMLFVLACSAITIKSVFFPPPIRISDADMQDMIETNERREALGLPPVTLERQARLYIGRSALDPNDYGSLLVTAIPLAMWLGLGAVRRRLFWGAVALLLVWGIVPTGSRGAMVGFFAVCWALLIQGEAAGRKRAFVTVLTVGAVVLFVAFAGSRFFDIGGSDYNLTESEGRWSFWKQGIIWMIKRPTGLGIDNYPTRFGDLFGPERAAHNSFVQYGAELGVAGLVAFVLLCHAVLSGMRRHRKNALAARSEYGKVAEDEAGLAGYVFASLVGTLVTGFFLSNAYLPLMYLPFGIATAVLLGSPLAPIDVPEPRPAAGRRLLGSADRSPGWRAERGQARDPAVQRAAPVLPPSRAGHRPPAPSPPSPPRRP
jgi:O-antigen ligase/polysaccharide polymerase Wzy-like membrane protein